MVSEISLNLSHANGNIRNLDLPKAATREYNANIPQSCVTLKSFKPLTMGNKECDDV